jgi:hypothetical protein
MSEFYGVLKRNKSDPNALYMQYDLENTPIEYILP